MLTMLKPALAMLGLTLPGYLCARLLRLPAGLATAFPLSALLMTEIIILFSVAGIPIRVKAMAIFLGALAAFTVLLLRSGSAPADFGAAADSAQKHSRLAACSLGVASLVILAFFLRTALYPLSGYDTFFRWEALARQMLQSASLSHYPPVSAADYSTYLIPDGIPPLVATVYWWFYAVIGEPLPAATSVPVTLQLLSAMALTAYGTFFASGFRAACWSLLAFSTSTLLINGFAIGQETGYTALSVAGQFCFAWAAVRKPRASLVVAAALFAALGAMARDYGPALALAGFLVLAWHAQTRRFLWLFVAVAAMLSIPWYLRVWIVTGNPLYPHEIPGGFTTNVIFKAIQNSYHEMFSFYRYGASQWLSHAAVLIAGAPLAVIGGIAYGATRWREAAPMMITAVIVTLLWLLSMGETAGGAVYSMRVLTPAFTALSMTSGGAGAYWCGQQRYGIVAGAVRAAVVLCALYALIHTASHPFSPRYFTAAVTYRHSGAPEFCQNTQELVNRLLSSDQPATGVLTSNAYLGTMLQADPRFRPVMVWSPEVSFVFDRQLLPAEIRRRLIEKNIRLVSLQDDAVNNRFLLEFPFYQDMYRDPSDAVSRPFIAQGSESLNLLLPPAD